MREYQAPAVMDNLRPLLALAAEEMIARGTETTLRQRLFVVLEEIFINVVVYAYASTSENGPVRVRLLADEDAVHLRVEDRGSPFNPLEYIDTRTFDDILEMEDGKEGIALIKALSRDVHYERLDGWNRLDVIIDGMVIA